ncbi:hypothetical protein AB0C10_21365 [Microbispora amethystogenes]|uniref:hypothetical protein n=1 Tax=Microbispora amethystogenes TaxID=1427754 RepID=UPI0033E71B4C
MPGGDGELTFAEKIRTIQVNTGRSAPRRRETRDDAGRIVRTVSELTESGAIATTRNRTSARGEHQDVHIDAPVVTAVSP